MHRMKSDGASLEAMHASHASHRTERHGCIKPPAARSDESGTRRDESVALGTNRANRGTNRRRKVPRPQALWAAFRDSRGLITASTGSIRRRHGHTALNDFGPSTTALTAVTRTTLPAGAEFAIAVSGVIVSASTVRT